MVIQLKNNGSLILRLSMVSGLKVFLTSLLVIAAITACSQEKGTMNSSNPSKTAPIVLKNTPANAESIVLGMGCFWGSEMCM